MPSSLPHIDTTEIHTAIFVSPQLIVIYLLYTRHVCTFSLLICSVWFIKQLTLYNKALLWVTNAVTIPTISLHMISKDINYCGIFQIFSVNILSLEGECSAMVNAIVTSVKTWEKKYEKSIISNLGVIVADYRQTWFTEAFYKIKIKIMLL